MRDAEVTLISVNLELEPSSGCPSVTLGGERTGTR